jgi:hypothetical protein
MGVMFLDGMVVSPQTTEKEVEAPAAPDKNKRSARKSAENDSDPLRIK